MHGAAASRSGRVVIIGADGLDAALFAQWLEAGRLPHLGRVAALGGWSPLRTTNPAESPVAWASFATGLNPGQHGIYDFLQRDPRTYGLRVGPLTVRPRLDGQGLEAINHRHGATMWQLASAQGHVCTLLRVPGTCPPEPVRGHMLSGLGVPDLLGSWGSSAAYTTVDADPKRQIYPLNKLGAAEYGATIEGPAGSQIPFSLRLLPGAVAITCQEVTLQLEPGGWSEWFSLVFGKPPAPRWHGIARFYLQALQDDVMRLYLTPVNIDPRQPCLPLTYPEPYSAELVARYGLFATLGWPEDASGLNEGRLDAAGFLDQVEDAFAYQARLTLDTVREQGSGLIVSVFESTDRVQHLFWQQMDPAPASNPVLASYERFDRFIGELLPLLEPTDTLLVLSDHGFKPVRRLANVNNWLRDQGWLVPMPGHERHGRLPQQVDWSRTRAYALGLSKVYFNLRGREAQGCVEPGTQAQQLGEALVEGLSRWRDPETDELLLQRVYRADELYHGSQRADSGDLILGFRVGYRTSQLASLGRWTAGPTVGDNTRMWGADHCSVDPDFVPGVVCCNRALQWEAPSLLDIAPTVLAWLQVPIPDEMDGRSLAL